MEEGEYLEGVFLYEAYRRLVQVYGYQVRQNNGHHMYRGIADNDVCQVRWRLLVRQPGSRYCAPQGDIGRRFMNFLAEEFHGARE